ncbi:MAG: serine/threonine-protein kinase PknK, partial [Desulfobacterales bacterium]|nr:serine/threonine-protein kinase PknK [Desulfobacterales bacterium]
MALDNKELEQIGFRVIERLYDGKAHRVYRAVKVDAENNDDPDGPRTVVVKIRAPLSIHDGGVDRLKHEFGFARLLRGVSGVARPLDLQGEGPWRRLIIEDFPGEQLSIYWSRRKLDLKLFLESAIQIIRIIGQIHRRDIIHKDISPENILINPKTKEIKIIDFSISARVRRETRAAVSLKNIEGTPAYMSPEQTGRMNRSIDYRSDFYSLGATLYEILTGRPPFDTRDLVNLVHSHMAIQPSPPGDVKREIPHALSDIIMRLLSKNAEDRYQSAAGLEADLQECLERLTGAGVIRGTFEIGRHDVSERFHIPEKLYGREAEIDALFHEFNKATSRGAGVMFFKGPPGIGKSFLINEIQKPLTREKGYFASGKCEQYNRDMPAGVFIQAFRDLISQILSASDEGLEKWKQEILDGVGENGRLMIRVVPELERVIGPQPPVPELPSSEKQNQFQRVFRDFVRVLANPDHPLALFLDDLQWIDNASLNLLKLLFSDKELRCLLLIGAYRDAEVTGSHPLNDLVKSRETVALGPLEVDDIRLMIAETLSTPKDAVDSLARLVENKTHGNPFFVKQFLQDLHMKGLLTFDPRQKGKPGWRFDIDRIHQADITDNVVKLMTRRVNLLSRRERRFLKIASCIGVWFDLDVLSMLVGEGSGSRVFNELLTPINDGMLVKIEEKLKFAHDRVQEAVYNLLDEKERTEIHYKLGRGLLEKVDASELEKKIFEIVR